MYRTIKSHLLALVFSLSVFVFSSPAQNPKPPVREYPGLITGQQGDDQDALSQASGLNADQTPLTGAQQFTLGSSQMRHSYWVPGFEFESNFQPNTLDNSGSRNLVSANYFLGTLSLLSSRRNAELAINYSGGGAASNLSALSGTYSHQLGLSQTFEWRRWQLRLLDQFSYIPESSFGFGGVSPIATPGVGGALGEGLPSLQTNYVPSQSLFASAGPRLTTGFVTELEYRLTPRSSLVAVGSLGALRFMQGSSVDTNDAIFSLGYDYRVTARDTIGILDRFTAYRYPRNPQALNDYAAQLAYGRKITGRLALQLTGGPEVTTYRRPNGSQYIGAAAGASLTYAFRRTHYVLTYSRGVNGGSGIATGSKGDQVQVRLSHDIQQKWQASLGLGYSRNRQILGTSSTSIVSSESFHSAFASAGLSHALSPTATFTVNYTFDYQNLNQPLCVAGPCANSYKQHQIWVGFHWRAHPFIIR